MKPRYYGAVWADYLHYAHAGKIAVNLVETNEKGSPLGPALRGYVTGPVPPTEAEIVAALLPGGIFASIKGESDEA